jgi:hypothetical protein
MIRVGEKERRRFDIILKSNFEQLTEPREKEISWAALRQKQILAGAEPMKKRLDVKAKKKKKKSKQRGRNTNIYELRHDPTVAPEKLLKRMLI